MKGGNLKAKALTQWASKQAIRTSVQSKCGLAQEHFHFILLNWQSETYPSKRVLKSISIRDLKNNNNNKIKNYFTIQKVTLSILQSYFTIYPTSQFLIIFHITFNTIQFFFFLIAPPPTTIIAHHNTAKQRMIHSKTTHSHSKTTYPYPFTTTKPINQKLPNRRVKERRDKERKEERENRSERKREETKRENWRVKEEKELGHNYRYPTTDHHADLKKMKEKETKTESGVIETKRRNERREWVIKWVRSVWPKREKEEIFLI